MLPRARRLSRGDFTLLLSKGRTRHYPLFSLRSAPFAGRKAAVVVSKKTAPLAVSRTRIKRRFYALLRGLEDAFPKDTAVAIFPRKESLQASQDELSRELKTALRDI